MKKTVNSQITAKKKKKKKMPNVRTLISLDWAMKKILRDKANFKILEGFLSELLKKNVKIKNILESESNKENEDDKHNRVDILAENRKGEIFIIEVQFSNELDYFQRMLYGVSKSITERIYSSDEYRKIIKVYSINIVYFPFGCGNDYIYHGTTSFTGIHNGEMLKLTTEQKKAVSKRSIKGVFPEYYILDVSRFNDVAKDTLDEWIYYLKNSEIKDGFSAKGLKEANEKLKYYSLSESEQRVYDKIIHYKRVAMGEIRTALFTGELKGIKKGRKEGRKEGLEEGRKEGIKEGRKEGIKEGRKEGREKGRKEGREEGIKEGREEGIKEGMIKVAKNMLDCGKSIKEVIEATGLTKKEITHNIK
jgi:predicted transposase/invertase (TIGR01784 family)